MKPSSLFALVALLAAALAGPARLSADSAAPAPTAVPAPIMVGSDIIVALPLDKAWSLLQDTAHWGDWNKNVTNVAQASVSLTAGSTFTYESQGRTITATVTDFKDSELLLWKGATTGPDVSLRWTLKAMDAGRTLVSLRAVLKPKAPDSLVSSASGETQAWMGSFQDEATRLVPAPAAAPAPKKRHHKAKAPVAGGAAAAPAPAAASGSPAAPAPAAAPAAAQ
jgi:hypothetical protein